MISNELKDNLLKLDFNAELPESGLLFTDNIVAYKDNSEISFDEILVLHNAQELRAKAVYFRRFEGRSSVPQLFIYDNSDHKLNNDNLAEIHKKIWSSGIVPIYYVFDQTEVKIFNGRKPLREFDGNLEIDVFDCLSLAASAHKRYKAEKYSELQFRNGSFWEREDSRSEFKADSSSSKKLIDELRLIRKEFSKEQNEAACNKLLVLSLLVKYLEERKAKDGRRVFPDKYFSQFNGAESFCDVLRNNKGLELFEYLGSKINGKIFALDEQEKKEIAKLNQSRLAEFLDAKTEGGKQRLFWRLYDFNYLPVELISRIYEEFIPKRQDIAYTPPLLVDFMIDECMPIDYPKDNIKVIDISCGSGIFLVTAFKRIVQWWQYQQFKEKGELRTPSIRTLKSLLRKSIYGVDLEGEAVRLAIFSLTIAMCEMLEPAKMWEELTQEKFLDLSDNIIESDFFDFVKTRTKYDLVIGNPPFNIPTKDEKLYWDQISQKVSFEYEIPYKNIALAFLQQAMKLLNENGRLGLVMPSGPLLYRDTLKFRENFLNAYNVSKIIDFTCMKSSLFDTRNVSVSIIIAEKKTPDVRDILHLVVRRTATSKEKLYFEVDKYDFYYVPKELARTEQKVWKINLLAGTHLYYFLKRMQSLRTLKDYLKHKKKKYGWEYGTGYFIGEPKSESIRKQQGRKPAKHLTGQWMIPTNKFNCDDIQEKDIVRETEKLFEGRRERHKKIFLAPHILIKTNIKFPIVLLSEKDLIFRRDITGIYAPQEDIGELKQLSAKLKQYRKVYRSLFMLSSGKAGISRATVIKHEDVLSLPYPENFDQLRLSDAEKIAIVDVLKYGFDSLSKGENSVTVIKGADSRALESFGKTFCDSLNSIYKEDNKEFYPLEPIDSVSYICCPVAYGNPEKPKLLSRNHTTKIKEGNLECLIDNPQGRNVLYKRIIKLYGKDMIYLIKPKTLRYWLKSIALRDANEVFTDLVSSGY